MDNIIELIKNKISKYEVFLLPELVSSHKTNAKLYFSRKFNLKIILDIIKYNFMSYFGIRKRYSSNFKGKKVIYLGEYSKTKSSFEELKTKFPDALFIFNTNIPKDEFAENTLILNQSSVSFFDYNLSKKTIILFFSSFLLLIKGNVSLKEFFYFLYGAKGLAFENKISEIFVSKNKYIFLNFFSATFEGAILNKLLKDNKSKIITYSWGSNIKAKEQDFVDSDLFLLKKQDPLNLYNIYKSKYIREIGISIIHKNRFPDFDLCIIDTCENDILTYQIKINILKKIKLEKLNVVYSWHPGTQFKSQIQKEFKKFTFSNDSIKSISSSRVIIDFHSTLQSLLDESNIEFISLSNFMYDEIYKKEIPNYFMNRKAFYAKNLQTIFIDYSNFEKLKIKNEKEKNDSSKIEDYFK
jgi:hypothetical protein